MISYKNSEALREMQERLLKLPYVKSLQTGALVIKSDRIVMRNGPEGSNFEHYVDDIHIFTRTVPGVKLTVDVSITLQDEEAFDITTT